MAINANCFGVGVVSKRPFAASDEQIPESWRFVAGERKTYLGWPEWSTVPRLPSGVKTRSGKAELVTANAETIEAIVQLADASGVGLEGARLRLVAWAFRMQEDVTATLEVPGGRSFVSIARLDAWPADPHMNLLARKHPTLRHIPARVEGCHVHRFADNAVLGKQAFRPPCNLPVAAPLPNRLQSFRDFLRTVSAEFMIDGIEDFNAPDWGVFI
jgi:hypothetical protein